MLGIPVAAPAASHRPPGSPPARDWRFRPDVEGLRAVAIAAVVGYHVGLPFLRGGFVGVDVFFVISGFLITGLLVAEVTASGRISLVRFWARRARRLLPAATLVLGVVSVASWWAIPALDHDVVGGDIVASALYVSNMRFAVQANDYLASDASPSPVLHFWSLGVEEQFYVVWPLLVVATAAVVVWRRRAAGRSVSRGPLIGVLAALGIVSFLVSLRLTARVEPWAFFGMPTRAWEFAIGGLLSLAAIELARLPDVVRRVTGWVGAIALLGSIALLDADLPYPGTAALWPVLGTAAVIAAGVGATSARGAGTSDPGSHSAADVGGVPALLSAWPMRAVGRLSYSWYLWHWPALVLAASVWGDLGVPVRLAIALGALIPSAIAYRYLERPLHHLPALVASPRRSLQLGAGLSAAAAAIGLALMLGPAGGSFASATVAPAGADDQTGRGAAGAAPQTPGSTPSTSSTRSPSPGATRTAAAIVWPTGPITPAPASARSDLPVLYSDGCHLTQAAVNHPTCAFGDTASATTVVLFGDSHAAQWFPALEALAIQHHWRLLARTKSGCPAPEVTIFERRLKRAYDECDTWRQSVIDELAGNGRPALVVAAGTRTESVVDRSTGSLMAPSVTAAEWQDGWTRTLAKLGAAGIPVAVLRDTPWPGRDMAVCVSRHASDPTACDVTRSALDKAAYDVGTATGSPTGHGVDLSTIICDADRCPATQGKYLVYRDSNHLTATFARALAPYLGAKLLPLVH